jgi:hypothetical protein
LSELGDLTAVPEPLWRAQAEVIRAVGEKGLDRARIDLDLTLRDPSLLRDRLAEIVQEWLRSSLIARGLQG